MIDGWTDGCWTGGTVDDDETRLQREWFESKTNNRNNGY